MERASSASSDRDGFTLIELLIVIVILGVLAVVVVFAVGGIRDRGDEAAADADERTLVTAEESYQAMHGTYASEADLVGAGLLRDESTLFDIELAADAASYVIGPTGSFTPGGGGGDGGGGGGGGDGGGGGGGDGGDGGGGPPTPQAASYPIGGTDYPATELDQGGSKLLVIIAAGAETPDLWTLLTTTPPADTDIVWFDSAGVNTSDDVDAILTMGADYVIAPYAVPITRTDNNANTYVGTYMDSIGWLSPGDYWWTHAQGQQNPTLAQIEAGLA